MYDGRKNKIVIDQSINQANDQSKDQPIEINQVQFITL